MVVCLGGFVLWLFGFACLCVVFVVGDWLVGIFVGVLAVGAVLVLAYFRLGC